MIVLQNKIMEGGNDANVSSNKSLQSNQIYRNAMDEMIKKLKPLKKPRPESYKSSLQISQEILNNQRVKQQTVGVMGSCLDGKKFFSESELQAKIYLFMNEQQKMDWDAGDKILKEFIIDESWTMHECMRLFKIGSERFKRIKSGRLKTPAIKNGGGQLCLDDSMRRDSIFILFVKYAHRCLADDNEPLIENSENHVIPNKPNVKKWKSVMDVFVDYIYFHSKSGWNYMLPFGRTTVYRKIRQHHPEILSIIHRNIATI